MQIRPTVSCGGASLPMLGVGVGADGAASLAPIAASPTPTPPPSATQVAHSSALAGVSTSEVLKPWASAHWSAPWPVSALWIDWAGGEMGVGGDGSGWEGGEGALDELRRAYVLSVGTGA